MLRKPPDILITTPESLYLLLTSRARETLRGVQTLILDEVHAVAGTKRGAHLALSVERLERLRRAAAAADRPLRDPAPARGDRPLRRRGAARSSSSTPAARRSSTSRSSSRSTTCGSPAAATDREEWPAASATCRSIWPSIYPRAARSSCASTARPSSSSTTAGSPSGSRCG